MRFEGDPAYRARKLLRSDGSSVSRKHTGYLRLVVEVAPFIWGLETQGEKVSQSDPSPWRRLQRESAFFQKPARL